MIRPRVYKLGEDWITAFPVNYPMGFVFVHDSWVEAMKTTALPMSTLARDVAHYEEWCSARGIA